MSEPDPPAVDATHNIYLVSSEHSKITNVSLYSGQAEITRAFKLDVTTGLNVVKIAGLPNVLDEESLRVEGRGAATIHDVTISRLPIAPISKESPTLSSLLKDHEITQKALERSINALAALEKFIKSFTAGNPAIGQIGNVIESYDSEAEKLDNKILELKERLANVEQEVAAERKALAGPARYENLGLQVAIGVFASKTCEVELVLIYAVRAATWSALYDIRVDTNTKEKPVTLIYKAAIVQSTGEAWGDVPLTLETANPTFGMQVPDLQPWNLSTYSPQPHGDWSKEKSGGGVRKRRLASVQAVGSMLVSNDDDYDRLRPSVTHRILEVSSKGNLSATFRVPGLISIPSDGDAHNVTIVQLSLDTAMSWVTVPKEDAKMHLKAKVKNASDYTLLSGNASVYVNGSYISKSLVPAVSPQESFDCPLGLDPSIRVTYHPQTKNASRSGFYQKTSVQVFSQRVTIYNTKTLSISNVKVVDQIPISEDSSITVKLLSPTLVGPETAGSISKGGKPPSAVKVRKSVIAQWDNADDPDFDVSALGKDGKLNWICSIPEQEKLNLLLSWEVTHPINKAILGL